MSRKAIGSLILAVFLLTAALPMADGRRGAIVSDGEGAIAQSSTSEELFATWNVGIETGSPGRKNATGK